MLQLIKFYKAKKFDPAMGLPKPNDFHDFPEYFVLEAIPHAVATVRTADKKSPREAVEFILQLLKYNDNSGNPYSDVFWLAALVEAVGELEFGQQCIPFLQSLLKQIDRLLQFDRLMSSYNGILTVSCIRAITQMALKLSEFVPLENVSKLIKSFRDSKATWRVRIEASRALLDLEFYCKGIDAALILFIKYLEKEPSLRGQAKLGVHMIRLSEISAGSGSIDDVKSQTLVALLRLLESHVAFCNVLLRHHLFCILQVLAGRCPTLYVVPRDHMRQMGYAEICSEQRNTFLAFINQMKPPESHVDIHSPFHNNGFIVQEADKDLDTTSNSQERKMQANGLAIEEATDDIDITSTSPEKQVQEVQDYGLVSQEIPKHVDAQTLEHGMVAQHSPKDTDTKMLHQGLVDQELPKDLDTKTLDQGLVTQDAQMDTKTLDQGLVTQDAPKDTYTKTQDQVLVPHETAANDMDTETPHPGLVFQEAPKDMDTKIHDQVSVPHEGAKDVDKISNNQETKLPVNGSTVQETLKDLDTVSNSQERRMPIFKIRVKQPTTSNKGNNIIHGRSEAGRNETDHGASSSVSVDASQRNVAETISASNQIIEEVNSCQGRGSHMTASIGSARVEREELGKELQCTADSSSIPIVVPQPDDFLPRTLHEQKDVDVGSLSTVNPDTRDSKKEKKKKKDKDKKRKRDDPEYLEKKRLKKEKKLREKERAKLLTETTMAMKPTESPRIQDASVRLKVDEPSGTPKIVLRTSENRPASESGRKIKIKIKKPGASGAS